MRHYGPIASLIVIVSGLALAFLAALAFAGFMGLLFTTRHTSVALEIDMTAYDRATQKPVPGCLVAFQWSSGVYGPAGPPHDGERTDAQGNVHASLGWGYDRGVLFAPFERWRVPALRFYLGDAPRNGTFEEVTAWDILLEFREPWRAQDLVPEVKLNRGTRHAEVLDPPSGWEYQEEGWTDVQESSPDGLVKAVVRFERDRSGARNYRIPISVWLDAKEIAACQAPTRNDAYTRAAADYEAHRYEEALALYREIAGRAPWDAAAYRAVGDCLEGLNRPKEAVPAYRKAAKLRPKDPELRYWYANSLIGIDAKAAEAEFREVVALEPNEARGYIGLAGALYDLERWREATEMLERARALCADCLNKDDRRIYEECRERSGRPSRRSS